MKKKILLSILAAVIGVFIFTVPALAEEPEDGAAIDVFIRIESGIPGAEETLLPRTLVTFDLTETEAPMALDALDIATDSVYEADISEYGAFVTSICGVSGEDFMCYWLFTVNDVISEVSADSCGLADGDELVFYCVDMMEAVYSYFTDRTLTAEAGEMFTLRLMGISFMEGVVPVEGALISIRSEAPAILPMIAYHTNENGEVEIFIPSGGEYTITAGKYSEDGVPLISKPLCIVTVESADDPDFVLGEAIIVEPQPVLPEPEVVISGGIIEYSPIVEFDYENGSFTLFGVEVALNGVKMPFYDENGVLYLPVRVIGECLGADVLWDDDTSTATVVFGEYSFSYKLSDVFDGFPVIVIEDRSYVPAGQIIKELNLGGLI